MRIYTKVVIDMNTGDVIESDSFLYDGPVSECASSGGGGKSTTTTKPDKKYNARMAAIAEEAQKWSGEMYNQFKYGVLYDPTSVDPTTGKTLGEINGYDPSKVVSEMSLMQKTLESQFGLVPLETEAAKMGIETSMLGLGLQQKQIGLGEKELGLREEQIGLESGKVQAEMGLLGQRTEAERLGLDTSMMGLGVQQKKYGLEGAQTEAEMGLLGQRTETTRLGLESEAAAARDRMKTIQERAPVLSKLYEEALSGVDVNRRVSEARAGVQQGFAQAQGQAVRDMSRYGIDPNSGRGMASFRNIGISKATALAGASTAAQNQAESESFERKKVALGLPS